VHIEGKIGCASDLGLGGAHSRLAERVGGRMCVTPVRSLSRPAELSLTDGFAMTQR
jgi:hypothetical protein